MDDDQRCEDCGHLPGCDCPHFCQPVPDAPDVAQAALATPGRRFGV